MKRSKNLCRTTEKTAIVLALAAALGLAFDSSAATGLTNNNSTVSLDFNSPSGMTSWNVDSVNQLSQQSFFYRVGSSGPQFDLTQITSTPLINVGSARQVTALYSNAQIGVRLSYTLTGQSAGSGRSGLNETVTIFNYSGSSLDFHLYLYSDFALGGLAGGQSVTLGTSGTTGTSVQSFANGNNSVSAITAPNHGETSVSTQTYTDITTLNGYTLNDQLSAGPANNVSWAWEWDYSIAPNSSPQISILDSLAVPEPSVIGLGLISAGLMVLRRRTS